MSLIPRPLSILAGILIASSGLSFGQTGPVNVSVYSLPASAARIISQPSVINVPANISANIPKNTPVSRMSVSEKEIPKNLTAVEAGKFLLNKGVACCEPLEHAHDNWYWCCDKAKLIQIEGGSQSAKIAFEKVLSMASKLDERAWAQIKRTRDSERGQADSD